jgi:hypothetical protein
LAAEGESINAHEEASSDDGDLRGKESRVDEKRDDDSERKRCTLLFGGQMRRMSEHMDVLKDAMSRLCCNLQIYAEKREWSRWGLVHGGRAAIECKANMMRADAVERAVHYDSDVTGHYDSDPEVIGLEVDYEESRIEEDDVARPCSRYAQERVGSGVQEAERVQPLNNHATRTACSEIQVCAENEGMWSRCGSVRDGATACKAERLMGAAAERVKRCYSEDDPEVIDIETGYKDNNIEEDVVERPRNRGRKAVPPLHAQGRVGGNVYEVYQVQPRSTMQRDVLIKNDSGAQITFVAPDLYEFGIKEGFIKNEREFESAPHQILRKAPLNKAPSHEGTK